MRLFDLIRSFPDQARLALGTRGVIWATAAGGIGLLCCAISMASIALSLHATEAGYTRHRTADLLALEPCQVDESGVAQVPEGRGIIADQTVT